MGGLRHIRPYSSPHRRKVEPVEDPSPVETEYRILEVGEPIQEGDEYFTRSYGDWRIAEVHTESKAVVGYNGLPYRRKVGSIKDPAPVETEYRFLEVGEAVQEGDELHGNQYRRKVYASGEPDLCTCGRIKVYHFMFGLICEDCEIQWQDPY